MTDWILSIQKPVMLFFQSIRQPFLSTIAECITFLGEGVWSVLLVFFLYYVFDKKSGFAVGAANMTGVAFCNILKVIFRIPRPWVKYPDELVPLRVSTATGYSFPSGHSTNAGSLYYSLYSLYGKKRAVKTVSVALMILIPLSRIYLGCHWPLDVVVGIALGIAAGGLSVKYAELYEDEERLGKLVVRAVPAAVIVAVADAVLVDTGVLEKTLWKDLSQAAAGWSAIILFGWIGKKHIHFTFPEGMVKRIILYVLGAGVGYSCTLLWLTKFTMLHYTLYNVGLWLLTAFMFVFFPLILRRLGFEGKEEAVSTRLP